jgi:Fic family protein
MFEKASPRVGQLVLQKAGDEDFHAFVPHPLPPNPPIKHDSELNYLLEGAGLALGRLDGATYLLPSPDIFLYSYVRKEAVLSSQIEGTQTTLVEFIEAERDIRRREKDTNFREVSNYVNAMRYGLERLQTLPLSGRLIREIHKILITGTRGERRQPGEFRTSQNYVGGTRPGNAAYVPPPQAEVAGAMGELDKFLNRDKPGMPILIKAGLAHAHFETIHPFLDGNGRLGRLLITFILCASGVLKEPLLYLSLFLRNYRQEYYDLLNSIRRDGDWEGWLKFYLRGIWEVSDQATETAKRIVELRVRDQARVAEGGKAVANALTILEYLFQSPIITTVDAEGVLGVSYPTARNTLLALESAGVIAESVRPSRPKTYNYNEYLSIIAEGVAGQ